MTASITSNPFTTKLSSPPKATNISQLDRDIRAAIFPEVLPLILSADVYCEPGMSLYERHVSLIVKEVSHLTSNVDLIESALLRGNLFCDVAPDTEGTINYKLALERTLANRTRLAERLSLHRMKLELIKSIGYELISPYYCKRPDIIIKSKL